MSGPGVEDRWRKESTQTSAQVETFMIHDIQDPEWHLRSQSWMRLWCKKCICRLCGYCNKLWRMLRLVCFLDRICKRTLLPYYCIFTMILISKELCCSMNWMETIFPSNTDGELPLIWCTCHFSFILPFILFILRSDSGSFVIHRVRVSERERELGGNVEGLLRGRAGFSTCKLLPLAKEKEPVNFFLCFSHDFLGLSPKQSPLTSWKSLNNYRPW